MTRRGKRDSYIAAGPLTVRQEVAHSAACMNRALGQLDRAWFIGLARPQGVRLTEHNGCPQIVLRDAVGRRGAATYRWIVARCGDAACPAQALIRCDSIERLVAGGIRLAESDRQIRAFQREEGGR